MKSYWPLTESIAIWPKVDGFAAQATTVAFNLAIHHFFQPQR
jgi:hypothetical protein